MNLGSSRRIVRSKFVPTQIPDGLVVRHRVLDLLSVDDRFTLVAAMPGYGKTVAVRQWIDTIDLPVAWLTLDLLDGEPLSFWSHLLRAIGSVLPGIDEEPAMLLAERGADDPLFLAALVAELETASDRVVLVLDGLAGQLNRLTLDGLALLVDRTGDRVALVVTSRSDPALPLARWRSVGWLNRLNEEHLRLTDDEAIEIAGRFGSTAQVVGDVVALNRRVDGWPIGLHMALLSNQSDVDDAAQASTEAGRPDRMLASYLVADVLESMSEQEREVSLSLSVVDWFDSDICAGLVGPHANEVVRRLLGRGVFLTVVDERIGAMRFHALFREFMEMELSWRDPSRRVDLHRRAAMLWRSRGDLMAAHRHLSAIGESGRAHQILVGPALELVDRGDLAALQQFAHQLPAVRDVDDINLALDLAVVAFFADGTLAARRWCDRSASLIETLATDSPANRATQRNYELRLDDLRCAIALLEADLVTALQYIGGRGRLLPASHATSEFEQRFPIVAARVMLAARQRDDADRWIRVAEQIPGPGIVPAVTVPTLRAWHEWLFGRLDLATKLIDEALMWMDDHFIGAHHFAFDTLITAGWCRLSTGELREAAQLAQRAQSDADILDCAWNHLQAGFLSARVALVTGDPDAVLRIIDDLRSRIAFDSCLPYADRLLGLEIEALAVSAQVQDLAPLIEALQPGPRRQLLRARFVNREVHDVDDDLAERATWPVSEQLQAELVIASRADASLRSARLEQLIAQCAETGWVLPFLGMGPQVDRLLRSARVEQLHPGLARTLAQVSPSNPTRHSVGDGVRLTNREMDLLELLPTHLSYAEMGNRLYLSVNTIKSNLKQLYRKLNASTRTQAVEIARDHGFL